MATLVLGALGTLVGGPIGGAIGALAGRQIDSEIISSGSREGPRLKDLSLTTSSYGSPIPRHFGRMRVAGSIIWATELKETSESNGGGKGKPKTTSYSYSTSFAVALSSRPIVDVGRIWADSNLLRGSAGDLKTGGTLRIYKGYGDQLPDPLIEAAQGEGNPAYRNSAYAIFEDLQLEDFGNRIPALTFELIADTGEISAQHLLEPIEGQAEPEMDYAQLAGFSDEGGSLAAALDTLGTLYPFAARCDGEVLELIEAAQAGDPPIILPEPVAAQEDGDFGQADGRNLERRSEHSGGPKAIRYYDTARDYQPGVQRAAGRPSDAQQSTLQFPGTLGADTARQLIESRTTRAHWQGQSLQWRIGELDPSLKPGIVVQAPGIDGNWLIEGWEWRASGVELQLRRAPPVSGAAPVGDSGEHRLPPDFLAGVSVIRAFELPWDGVGSHNQHLTYVAVGSDSATWKGASLYSTNNGALEPIGPSGRQQSIIGELVSELGPSLAVLLESDASIEVDILTSSIAVFTSVSAEAIAQGRNRLLVGDEIIQFAVAEQISDSRWKLSGLLRGRGGTEDTAKQGHAAGAAVISLDANLIALDPAQAGQLVSNEIIAIGLADEEPVSSVVSGAGTSTRPLTPVHPRIAERADGGLDLCWTRRARGAWSWPDFVETPVHEETEQYQIGIGDTHAPAVSWIVTESQSSIDAAQRAAHPGQHVWVMQIGQFDQSRPLLIAILD